MDVRITCADIVKHVRTAVQSDTVTKNEEVICIIFQRLFYLSLFMCLILFFDCMNLNLVHLLGGVLALVK